MKVQSTAIWTPAQWYNSEKLKVSYKRIYKSASSSIVDMLGKHTRTMQPEREKRFTVIREPYARAVSIYKELVNRPTLKKRKLFTFSDYLEYTLKAGYFDKHQFPQIFWLRNLPDIKLFKMEDITAAAIWAGVDPDKVKTINPRKLIVEVNNRDKEIIKELYFEDIVLYETL